MKEILEAKAGQIEEKFSEMGLPEHMRDAVISWLWSGYFPGSFLTAVIENNFKEAALCADHLNGPELQKWAQFFTWYMPSGCWGSPEDAKAWHETFGWNGILNEKSDER